MRMILFCLLSVAVGTDPHQNSIRALAHDIHTATHSLPSIQAWQHLQSRLSIDNVDPQTLPPGLRKEVWKVWFNLANALRSTSDSGHWNDASWIYQQLCGAPTQQSPPLPSTTTTAIPTDFLPLSGGWKACMSWAGLSLRFKKWEHAAQAFALGCANIAVETDVATALTVCFRVQQQLSVVLFDKHAAKQNRVQKVLNAAKKQVDHTLHLLTIKQGGIGGIKPLRIRFLIPAWDEADSMTRSMSFLRDAATKYSTHVQVVDHKPDIEVISDDCATFGTRNRIHPSRIYPGAIRIRYEDECPQNLCALCMARADVFLMSYKQEHTAYSSTAAATAALHQHRVIVHTPQPANSKLFYKNAAGTPATHHPRPVNVLLTGCTEGVVMFGDYTYNTGETHESNAAKTWIYPLRRRLATIVQSGLIVGAKFRKHPGYGRSGGAASDSKRDFKSTRRKRERQLTEYAAELQSAKIVFVTRSHRDYALRKYTEAAFAGALLVGDIPTERVSLFRRFVVEIKIEMSDQTIVDRVLWWLSHAKERRERAQLGQQLMSQMTFANKLKAALGGAALFRSKKFGSFTYEVALAAHEEWVVSNDVYQETPTPRPTPLPPQLLPPPPPKWWGIYIGWVGNQNIGDDALVDIFATLLFGKKIVNHASTSTQVSVETCTKINHGSAHTPPLFVALGGGSLLRTNYIDVVDEFLSSYPNAIPLMFGSGWDDYEVTLNASEARTTALESKHHYYTKESGEAFQNSFLTKINTNASVSKNIRFWKRPWIGGVRGPITRQLLHHHLHNYERISLPPTMYDPGMIASFLVHAQINKNQKYSNSAEKKMQRVLLNVGLSPVYPVFEQEKKERKGQHHQHPNQNLIQIFGNLAGVMAVNGIHVTFVPAWFYDIDVNTQAAAYGKRQWKHSQAAVKKVFTNAIDTVSKVPSLLELLSMLKNVDVVIAMRLHIVIFAHSMQVPFVAVAYRLKTFDWAASVDMLKYVVSLDTVQHHLLYTLAKKAAFDVTLKSQMAAHNEAALSLWRRFKDDMVEKSGRSHLLNSAVCSGICNGFVVFGECSDGRIQI